LFTEEGIKRRKSKEVLKIKRGKIDIYENEGYTYKATILKS
jgi:hypothetical protein